MASFPTLKSGKVNMYPTTRAKEHGTRVVTFCDDSEQRWKGRAGLATFVLEFTDIDGYDLSTLSDFFRTVKAKFDTTWDLTLDGTTYQHMMFDADEFTFVESKPNRYSIRLACKQWRKN
jgi:hypothetical protein